ncbi:uncharacterized protein ARMOST_17066 [Armillaria ostoyae]|uniref:Uncharacterized protein n=1 Tax=Armillaria ostoyae TaxID=47428 RepID=A0A284RXZ0_ARMOS|nr:uncharacterized protein ARMOST_17066 [Armillaria ostoyae]
MPDQLALEQYGRATTRVQFACLSWCSTYDSSVNATTLDCCAVYTLCHDKMHASIEGWPGKGGRRSNVTLILNIASKHLSNSMSP